MSDIKGFCAELRRNVVFKFSYRMYSLEMGMAYDQNIVVDWDLYSNTMVGVLLIIVPINVVLCSKWQITVNEDFGKILFWFTVTIK